MTALADPDRRHSPFRMGWTAAALALALVTTGCAGAPASSAPDGPRPPGTPIRVMVMAPTDNPTFVLPELPVAARAAARYVNARGGVDQHPVDIVYCNDKNDPNLATKCAQEAIDGGMAGLVGSASFNMSTTVVPMMEKAGIAVINPQQFGPMEITSSTVFQTGGSFYAGYSAVGAFLKAKGVRSASFIHSTSAAAQATVDNVRNSLQRSGLDLVADVSVPLNSGSVTPAVAQAVNADADAIIVGTNSTVNSQIFPELRRMGVDFAGKVVVSYASTANDLMVEQIGPEIMEGVYALGTFPALTDGAMQDYVQAMDAEDPDRAVTRLDTSAEAFSSVLLFAKAAEEVEGEITGTAVLDALRSSEAIDIGMGTPPYTPGTDGPDKTAPRLSNNTVFVYQIVSGTFVTAAPGRIDDPYSS